MVEKTETFKILNHSNDVTENATIRPLICDSWRISLIDLANEVLQFSEKKPQTIEIKKKASQSVCNTRKKF